MAFTLGSFAADSTLTRAASSPSANSTLTRQTLTPSADSTRVKGPGYLGHPQVGGEIPTRLTVVPTGGITLGGAADIVGDPVIPVGGITLGGAATVGGYSVLLFSQWPLGGVTVGGTAGITASWIQYRPVGGVTLGGAATVTSSLILQFPHVPAGGVTLGGTAIVLDSIPFHPSGGVALGGTAQVTALMPLTVTPTGGLSFGGAAPVSYSTTHIAVGGVTLGGGASVSDAWITFTPDGGIAFSGTAAAYMFPAGYSPTSENPTNLAYPGWAINYETNAVSRYEALAANSMCILDGVTYVANAGGIYALNADMDGAQPIHASVTLPESDYGDPHNKRLSSVYLGINCSGQASLKAGTNKTSGQYYTISQSGGSVRGSRVVIGKGINGRFWNLRLSNAAGSDFELYSLQFKPSLLQRHGV